MKANKIEQPHRARRVLAVAVASAIVLAAMVVGFGKLKDLYLEQCVLKDVSAQVSIKSGKMVKADVIAENLGLKPGVNLAKIDFKHGREELLKRIPTLRSVSITRHLPDKLSITAEERIPVAKMGLRGRREPTGRVVDEEGVVFPCLRGTQLLPTIVETSPATAIGHKLRERSLSALRLILACREPKNSELQVLNVDTAKPDYLMATLGGSYARVKITWEGIDEPGSHGYDGLAARLSNLKKAMHTEAAIGVKLWNATMPDKIFADTERTN